MTRVRDFDRNDVSLGEDDGNVDLAARRRLTSIRDDAVALHRGV